MELQWGDSEGAVFFTKKLPVWLARAQLASPASNNKPTRGHLGEWCRLHVCQEEAISLQDWRSARAIRFV